MTFYNCPNCGGRSLRLYQCNREFVKYDAKVCKFILCVKCNTHHINEYHPPQDAINRVLHAEEIKDYLVEVEK